MSQQQVNTILKPILDELDEIGASANSSIDIILNEMQKQKLDTNETANFLMQNFPQKADEITKKIKEIAGIEIKPITLNTKPQSAQKPKEKPLEDAKITTVAPELQKLQELYEFVPKPFWQKVITTAEQFKKLTENF